MGKRKWERTGDERDMGERERGGVRGREMA